MVSGAAQRFNSDAQVGVSPTRSALQNVPFTQQCRQVAGLGTEADRHSGDHHVGQSWMNSDVGEPAAVRGEGSLRIERSELSQQITSLGQRACRRRIEEGEFGRFNDAPFREIQCQRSQVRLQDFRRAAREERLLLGRRPEAITGARFQSAGSTTSLIGCVLGHTNGIQPRQP